MINRENRQKYDDQTHNNDQIRFKFVEAMAENKIAKFTSNKTRTNRKMSTITSSKMQS